jgi:SpoVK/Ycf46/Vps4 family AAA+-type ATPase
MNEARHLFYTLKHNRSFDTDFALQQIHKVKEQTLLKESCLKMVSNNLSLVHIGGLDNVKHWVTSRKALFTAEAKQSGIPLPSGVLFMGISGCGKSLAAKTIASAWDLQLIRLDMNLIMSGAFGSPELAFERATKTAESIAPVVLWIDEIENAFGYDQNSATSGNLNVFGSFLTWMQEKPDTVFLAATANRIALLPAEMIRRGRFDQVFFLDLPHPSEREEIFRIHIAKNKGDTTQFNLPALAKLTEGWTGAEIEQAVNAARVHAFTSKKEFSSSQIFRSIGQSVPLSETMHEQLNELRRWSFNRATPASSQSTYGK